MSHRHIVTEKERVARGDQTGGPPPTERGNTIMASTTVPMSDDVALEEIAAFEGRLGVEPGRNQLMSEFGWGGSRASRLLRLYRERKQRPEAVRLLPELEADRSEAAVQQSGSEAVRSGAVDRSGEQSGEQSGGPARKTDGVDRSASSGLGRSSEAVQSGGPVQQSGSEAVRSASSSGPVVRSGGADQSGPVVRSGGAVRSDGAARGEQSTSPDQDDAVGVEAAQAGLVRVEGLVPSLDRREPDPWVEGWTGGPADQSEVDGVVDRSGVVAQASMSGPNTGPVDRVEARTESGGLVRSTARAGVADRSGPGASSGVVDRSGGPGEAAGLVDRSGPGEAAGLVDRSGGVVRDEVDQSGPVEAAGEPVRSGLGEAGPVVEAQRAGDADPRSGDGPDRKPWGLIIAILAISLSAFTAVWGGWVGLGRMVGFGKVNLLPGFVADGGWATIDLAITLPIGIEAYAASALYVAVAGLVRGGSRWFAGSSAGLSLALGAFGQAAYHVLDAQGRTVAPEWIVVFVSVLPVVVLGMAGVLLHLVLEERKHRRRR
ncbi:hypothetical protein P1312_062 [Thermobifida phage P1312]|nr:hypothetical protein P1312_062 [Thermobifida phage P1312]